MLAAFLLCEILSLLDSCIACPNHYGARAAANDSWPNGTACQNCNGHASHCDLKSSHLAHSSFFKECSRAVAIYLGLQGKTSCNATATRGLAFMCLSCGLVSSTI